MTGKIHIKRLYGYILKTFIPLFLMTFAICLFLVLMQFLWKYVEDMVGKGLGINVIGEMFLYAALTLVPMALPLSILLASLMIFGDMGESLELLAIKSAGIPLLRIMRPLIIFIFAVSVGTFFFQNNALPKINAKFFSLLISIRQASPELDIPEGVFYKGIDGYNVYVERKDQKTGMLYDVLIYDIGKGFNETSTTICDSAEMSMAEDKTMLIFTMYSGQRFQNFTEGTGDRTADQSKFYARESFDKKTMMIPYDANFNRMGEEVIEGSSQANYVSKNLSQLMFSIDSMKLVIDSVNVVDRKLMREYSYLSFRNSYPANQRDSLIAAAPIGTTPNPDSLFLAKDLMEQSSILQGAYNKAENNSSEFMFRSMNKTTTQRTLNLNWIEWHRKFTIPFACLVFFFIGAPLGSIVRKGGIGTPIVISVVLFIIYYILDNVGRKMARDGVWDHWVGMWFSAMILLPLGIFLTYKAMNDSVILNIDTYFSFFRKLLFIREKRKYPVKSVVIDTPPYAEISDSFHALSIEIDSYLQQYGRLPYKTFWTNTEYENKLKNIKSKLEVILGQVSNSRDVEELAKAEEFPVLINHIRPFRANSNLAKACMYVFPVGMIFKLFSWPFEGRIRKDLQAIKRLSAELNDIIKSEQHTDVVATA